MKKLLFLTTIIISTLVSAKTYYVSTKGHDSNNGTITQPLETWQKAFETAVGGDTVYFRVGGF